MKSYVAPRRSTFGSVAGINSKKSNPWWRVRKAQISREVDGGTR